MRNRHLPIALFIALILFNCKQEPEQDSVTVNSEQIAENLEKINFPDFGFMVSPDSTDARVFKLSDDFPDEMPEQDEALKEILKIDFKSDWENYMNAVQEYVFAGNAKTDYENAFYLEDNSIRKWYHVPWQHWGPSGREGYHGLTQEGPVGDKVLGPTQHSKSHAYAVGFYNDLGGYTIGKVWKSNVPNYSSLSYEGFPEGTVVAKLLFVPLTEEEVPYLSNPVSWQAYIYESDIPGGDENSKNRTTYDVNVIQMDIMVKDPRAKETGGWVFGTFVYNGELGNLNRWQNLMPVGIMWGNDPDNNNSNYNLTPTETVINPNLKETIINPSENLPPMHLGFNSRLNGPVDNGLSSCMSCHSAAEYPVISNILPQFNKNPEIPIPPKDSLASKEWMRWFRNIPCGEPFDTPAVSFDYSLQLVKSIQNYIEYASASKKGHYYEEYWTDNNKIRRNQLKN